MTYRLILVTAVLFAAVQAGPGGHGRPRGPKGPGGPGGPAHLPPFLKNVSAAGKKEFDAVFKNENLTIAQIDSQIAALATKYGVSAIYAESEANRTAHLAEVKKNQTAVINKLTYVAAQLDAVFQNKEQTRKAQRAAIEAVHKESPVEVDTIRFIRDHVGGHKHGGPGGPHGGPHGGHHGKGGRHGGHGAHKKH